jgi:glycosyltransferase involved in cell wall biosynthesis
MVLKNYNSIQYLSNAELKNCKLKTSSLSNKTIIPNGVKKNKIKKKNYFNKPLKFLYIGRIDENQKGLLSFFSLKMNTNAIFNLYGPDSKTKKELLKLNHPNLLIHDSVYELKEKEALFIEHDFAFLPSYFEGLPIFGLEVLSHGLPLICTNSCNLNFLGKSKSLIIVENQKEIINFIQNINVRDYDRSEMFDAAKFVVKDLSWDKIKQKIISIYF